MYNKTVFHRVDNKNNAAIIYDIPCDKCNGKYEFRLGKYGFFAGCSRYPQCQSKLKITAYVLKYIELNGIRIYRWNKKCYKCGNITSVYSYYLSYELENFDEYVFGTCASVGLGDIKYVDTILSSKISTIKPSYSYTTNTKYMANTCEHCGALQGRNYVVDDPDEIFDELYFTKNMDKYLYAILRIGDVSKISRDIKRLYTVIYEQD